MRRIQLARMKMQGMRVFIFDWWDDDEELSEPAPEFEEDSADPDKFAEAIEAQTSAVLRRVAGVSFTSEDLAIGESEAEPETATDSLADLDPDFAG
jgi:hypothetical protein